MIATGPVSSGGDQQRDAESFTTRLPNELPHAAGFAAAASTSPVVVACTVQNGGLKQKVLSDLAGICAEDAAPVEHIAFFSVHPISEGITHELQRTARESYQVTLDIFCGGDIATFLTQQDLIWVARHYLELPSHLVPPPEEEPAPQWYTELLEGLRKNQGPIALTPAVQGEVTHGLRHAMWDKNANSDLPEWLDFMGAFLADSDEGADTELVFRACYEMAVARFRGMGIAAGIEDLVRRGVDFACTSSQPSILDDAVTLVSYWGTMWISGVAKAEADEIGRAMSRLRVCLAKLIQASDPTTHPVRSASLAGTLACANLAPEWERIEMAEGKPTPAEVALSAGVQLDEHAVDTTAMPASYLYDVDAAMECLEQVVDLLPRARAYSSSVLARVFTLFAPVVSSHPSYEKVRDGLDLAQAEVQGDAVIAQRCRDRGMAFVRAGQPLKALAELHTAKVKWFNGDTIYGSILTMRYLGRLYAGLGLMYAAKLYTCTAAALAVQSEDGDVKAQAPKALLEAAAHAQHAGTWIDAARLTEIALLARAQLLVDPFNDDIYPELATHRTNATLELAAIRSYWPDLETLAETVHSKTGWYKELVEVVEFIDSKFDLTEDEFQTNAVEQLAGPLFGDIGDRRIIDFEALGVRWIIEFDNNQLTVLTAEAFAATLQILLADIAPRNPVLIRSTVRINVEVNLQASGPGDDIDIDESQPEISANVVLSSSPTDTEARTPKLLAMCFQLLHAVHVRPPGELEDLLEPIFKGGIIHKVSIGRPYEETAGLLDVEHYALCASADRPPSSVHFHPAACEHLAASTAPGSGYDQAASLQAIRERYEVANDSLRLTLPRLLSDQGGRATLLRLRNEGWLDWQILVTLVNLVMNWRAQHAGMRIGQTDRRRILQLAREPESPSFPEIPLSEFADDQVNMFAAIQAASVACRWDLRGRSEGPGEFAMRDLLTRRYRYAVDDIPHRDLLDCLDEEGKLLPFLDLSMGRDS